MFAYQQGIKIYSSYSKQKNILEQSSSLNVQIKEWIKQEQQTENKNPAWKKKKN